MLGAGMLAGRGDGLPLVVTKNIADKLYERRKVAALEVEQIVKQAASAGDLERVRRVVEALSQGYALSPRANARKGGLLCLAATAVGLSAATPPSEWADGAQGGKGAPIASGGPGPPAGGGPRAIPGAPGFAPAPESAASYASDSSVGPPAAASPLAAARNGGAGWAGKSPLGGGATTSAGSVAAPGDPPTATLTASSSSTSFARRAGAGGAGAGGDEGAEADAGDDASTPAARADVDESAAETHSGPGEDAAPRHSRHASGAGLTRASGSAGGSAAQLGEGALGTPERSGGSQAGGGAGSTHVTPPATPTGRQARLDALLRAIVPPILASFTDPDGRVRYYALEALYNVVKSLRGRTLALFPDVFDALFRACADADQSVQTAASFLDNLVKDVAAESPGFDLAGFIADLEAALAVSDPYKQQFVLGWISLIDSLPDTDLALHLPRLLPGLLRYLSVETAEIRHSASRLLHELEEDALPREAGDADGEGADGADDAGGSADVGAGPSAGPSAPPAAAGRHAGERDPDRLPERGAPSAAAGADEGGVLPSSPAPAPPRPPAAARLPDPNALARVLAESLDELPPPRAPAGSGGIPQPTPIAPGNPPRSVGSLASNLGLSVPLLRGGIPRGGSVAAVSPAGAAALGAAGLSGGSGEGSGRGGGSDGPSGRQGSLVGQGSVGGGPRGGATPGGRALASAPSPRPFSPDEGALRAVTTLRWLTRLTATRPRAVAPTRPAALRAALVWVGSPRPEVAAAARRLNRALAEGVRRFPPGDSEAAGALLDAADAGLDARAPEASRAEALAWLPALARASPGAVSARFPSLLDSLFEAVSGGSDAVLAQATHVLGAVAGAPDRRALVLARLLGAFRGAQGALLLRRRGPALVVELCRRLGAREVYSDLATALRAEHSRDDPLVASVVQVLCLALLRDRSLAPLREHLSEASTDPAAAALLANLHAAWGVSAAAALALTFVVKEYELAHRMVLSMAAHPCCDRLEAAVECCQAVSLLESPSLAPVRQDLLLPGLHPSLPRALLALLMLLPQGDAFRALDARLRALPAPVMAQALGMPGGAESFGRPAADARPAGKPTRSLFGRAQEPVLDADALLAAFDATQRRLAEGPNDPAGLGDRAL